MFCWTPEPPVVHFDNGNLSDNIASNKKKGAPRSQATEN
jgi:hypothetical protein